MKITQNSILHITIQYAMQIKIDYYFAQSLLPVCAIPMFTCLQFTIHLLINGQFQSIVQITTMASLN